MEKYYKNVIYDICQLIKTKKYKRSIMLCQFLIQKGFRTNELLVIFSYAKKMVEGCQEGLRILQDYSVNQSLQQAQGQQLQIKNPLLQMVKIQYNIQIQNIKEANESIKKLLNLNQNQITQQLQQQNQLCSILSALSQNYSNICEQQPINEPNQNFQINSSLHSITQEINSITKNYMQQKQLIRQKQSTEQYSQIILKYGQYYLQYQQIKQKLLLMLSNQVKFDQKKALSFNIKKKQAKIYQIDDKKSIINKIKKRNNKQLFFKQVRPISSIHKSPQKFKYSRVENANTSQLQNHLQQLKILLKTLNNFISFFKNKLNQYEGLKNKKLATIQDHLEVQSDEKEQTINNKQLQV